MIAPSEFRVDLPIPTGHFITTFASSILRFHRDRRSIKVLPLDLPDRPWPVAIVTVKNRTLNPIVERFIQHIRDFTRPMALRGRPCQPPSTRVLPAPSACIALA